MNKIIENRIQKVKEKLNCKMENCGSQFVFEIDKDKYKIVKNNLRYRYLGKCKRCQKIVKLPSNFIQALNIGFGKCEFKITDNKFDELFETK